MKLNVQKPQHSFWIPGRNRKRGRELLQPSFSQTYTAEVQFFGLIWFSVIRLEALTSEQHSVPEAFPAVPRDDAAAQSFLLQAGDDGCSWAAAGLMGWLMTSPSTRVLLFSLCFCSFVWAPKVKHWDEWVFVTLTMSFSFVGAGAAFCLQLCSSGAWGGKILQETPRKTVLQQRARKTRSRCL